MDLEPILRLAGLLTAGVILPVSHFAVCRKLKSSSDPKPPYAEFFAAFSTFGGWVLSLAISPSVLCVITFALTFFIAVPAALFMLVRLAWRLPLSRSHAAAFTALSLALAIPVLITVLIISYAPRP